MTPESFKEDMTMANEKAEMRYADYITDWENDKEVPGHIMETTHLKSGEFSSINTPTEMVALMADFNEDIVNLPKHINGEYSIIIDTYYSDIDENNFRYEYSKPCNKDTYVRSQAIKLKNEFVELLKPENQTFYRSINCKLLELFMTGVLTFEALQKLVYSDCDL